MRTSEVAVTNAAQTKLNTTGQQGITE